MTPRTAGLIAAVLITAALPHSLSAQPNSDWAALGRYRAANAELGPPKPGEQRVVFYGNSITEAWAQYFGTLFPGKAYVGRGISAQTTPQLLVRFRQDVIALHPAAVVILAGTNDIAGNTGPSTLEMIEDNLESMVELAKASGIRVVLSSVLPVFDYPWKPGLEPAQKIVALNRWMKAYAEAHGVVYLDYHSAMKDQRDGLRTELSTDGVHPNEAGYRIMAPLVEQAIAEALRGSLLQAADSTAGRVYAAVLDSFYLRKGATLYVVRSRTITGFGHIDDVDYASGVKGLQPLPQGLQADFESRRKDHNTVRLILSRVPTRFVTDSQVRALYDLGSEGFGKEFHRLFSGAIGILGVSPVGFSSDGQSAMVMVDDVESTVYYLLRLERGRWIVIRRVTVRAV